MMTSRAATIQLLVVATKQDDAQLIESELRNGGYAARARWVSTPDEAYDALGEAHPDIVLCSDDITPAGALPVIQACHKRAPRVPLVVVSNVRNMERLVSMMEAGARDVISRRNRRHMEMVITRELDAYRQARELADARLRMQDLDRRHKALLSDTDKAVAYVHEGILTHVNPAFRKLLQYDASAQLDGAPLMDMVSSADRSQMKREIKSRKDGEVIAVKLRDAQGNEHPVNLTVRTVEVADEAQLELVINPAGENDTPRKSSGRDNLYSAFDKRAEIGPGAEPSALIFIRLDGGDELRTGLGMRNADRLAHALHEALSQYITPPDRLYEFDFGEFVWLVDKARGDAPAKAAELRGHIAGHMFTVGERSHTVTVSQAIGLIPAGGCNTDALLTRARTLAVKVSAAGGNDISQVESDESGISQVDDGLWQRRIEEALKHDQFTLAFQAIVSLEDDTQRHFDTFVRLRGGNGETIKPGEFLPSAERLALDGAIDRCVLGQVFDLLIQRQDNTSQSCVFVKLSAHSMNKPDEFIAWLRGEIERRELRAEQLVLQAREPLVRTCIAEAKGLSESVRPLGCRFAIDHFGDSGQSLPLLDHIPVDFIKIAPHLTESLGDGQQLHVKLRQIMERAQELEIKTIAEYVQSANAMATLWQLGVNFIQGNYVQTPEVVGSTRAKAASD